MNALVASLRLDQPSMEELLKLDDNDWRSLLALTDRMHATLALAERHRDIVPDWVRERFDRNIAGNAKRRERNCAAFREIAAALESKGIEVAILKGVSHDVTLRPQGDHDLLCAMENAEQAQTTVIALGYEPITKPNEFPADHMPLLVRRSGWTWRGDFFDPDHPPSVEIHFRLWDEGTERIRVQGTEQFWSRRQKMTAHGLTFAALDPVDRLSYAALHVLRHILHGDLILFHIYELALMLDRCAPDTALWSTWEARYDESFRTLQSIVFRLAQNWFGCRLHKRPELPESVERWLESYARTPSSPNLFANKSELWLHTSLVESRVDAFRVIRRKLLPKPRYRLVERRPAGQTESLKPAVERAARHSRFLARRVVHHLRTLPIVTAQGVSWWLRSRGLSAGFFQYVGASSLFVIGMTTFFLLYNLHLVKLGFKEDFIGSVSSAMTIGTILGTLPAGFIASRFGLKAPLLIAFGLGPLLAVVRTLVGGPTTLIGFAFFDGIAMSMNAVALTPTVAQLVPEKARPLAFSLLTSWQIGIGIIGSAGGGRLPKLLGGLTPALLIACSIAVLGAIAATRLPLGKPPAKARIVYPRDPAITRFLAALALWSLATGALNPFFNVYFSVHLKAPPEAIGLIFARSQLTQALAVLAAPLILRRLGMPLGVMAMQMTTGVALALLATQPPLAGAAILYACYMTFQYMSEPGMFSFLMDHAEERERGGASALYMLILFAGQAIASKVSGQAIVRFGYGKVMTTAALLAIVAGLCFRLAMSRRTPELRERTAAQ